MSSEIQFCCECSNLLYPKEDVEHKQLIFLCRSCDHLQYADPYSMTQNCVDRLNYNFRSKEDVNSYIAQGLDNDPTLPRAPDWKCPSCSNIGAVYFQLPERVADDAMTLVFVCTECTFYQVKGKEISNDMNASQADLAPPSGSPRKPLHSSTRETLPATTLPGAPNPSTTQTAQQTIVSPTNVEESLAEETEMSIILQNEDEELHLGLEELGLGISDTDDDNITDYE